MAERILQDIAEQKERLTKAQINKNKVEKADVYCNLGRAYCSLRDFHQAIEYNKQYLSIAKEVGDRAGEGSAYCNLGVAYCSLQEFQRAIEYFNKYLIITQEVGNRAGQGKGYGNLGYVYLVLGKYQRAIEYINKCLIIAQDLGDREMEGFAYANLGVTYHNLEELPRAMECHKKHLSIAMEVGDRKGKGNAYTHIGDVHETLGDVPQAMEYYKQSLSNDEEIGDRHGQGIDYCRLGRCYRHLDDLKEAIECYKKHLKIAEETGDRIAAACAHIQLGHSFQAIDSLNEAVEHFRCCLKICDTIRANSISEDQLKISFSTLGIFQCAYINLWKVLVMLQRNYEALYAAEKGRAQALLDALKETYGLPSLSPRSMESEEEVRYISKKTTVLTVFLALRKKNVYMWVLGKEDNPIFRQAEIEIGREHEDSFTLLLNTVLKKIGAGVGIRCENRSMDQLSDDSTSSTRDDNQTSEPSQETTNCLPPLYDILIGPIEDLLDGDELIVVPDGALSKFPWAQP